MAQIPNNTKTIEQNWKENGFQIIKSMMKKNTCLSSMLKLISGKSEMMSSK